jgi:N-methylhydantoinase A
MWRVGIDVGGTFTDLFAWEDGSSRQLTSKVLTTKHDRAVGVLNAIREAGIEPSSISHLMHGTTTATNALITRDYPEAAMITTDGFRDTIEIGRQHREALYDPYQQKPKPIIKRRFRYTIDERMDAKGKPVRPLDRAKALAIAEKIKAADIKSVAIAFINSYVNAAHENQMRDIVLEVNPGIYCVTSADTRPVFREHGPFRHHRHSRRHHSGHGALFQPPRGELEGGRLHRPSDDPEVQRRHHRRRLRQAASRGAD